MTLSTRRWLPPELLAVAALLIVTVGGAGIGWYLKAQSVATNEAMAEARKAWVSGDVDATLTSLERCASADCARLAAAVKRAKPQLAKQLAIDQAERGSLLALDLELSGGQRSVIALQLEPRAAESDDAFEQEQTEALVRQGFPLEVSRRAVALFIAGLEVSERSPDLATRNFREVASLVPGTLLARRAEKRTQAFVSPEPAAVVEPPPVQPESIIEAPAPVNEAVKAQLTGLLQEGKDAKKEKRYSRAVKALEQCLSLSPNDVECTVALASTLAQKGAEENDAQANTKAAALYRTFLRIAPLDDKRRARVQEIVGPVEAPPDPSTLDARLHDLYLRGYQLREASPDEARRLFEEVVRLAPDSVDAQKARLRIEELPAARRVARLKIASTPTAARVFIDGVDTGRLTPVLPGTPLEVSPGRHTIYAELNGRRSATTEFTVFEGDSPVIRLVIE